MFVSFFYRWFYVILICWFDFLFLHSGQNFIFFFEMFQNVSLWIYHIKSMFQHLRIYSRDKSACHKATNRLLTSTSFYSPSFYCRILPQNGQNEYFIQVDISSMKVSCFAATQCSSDESKLKITPQLHLFQQYLRYVHLLLTHF